MKWFICLFLCRCPQQKTNNIDTTKIGEQKIENITTSRHFVVIIGGKYQRSFVLLV